MILEACISTVEGLKAAREFNINRVEICQDLKVEGLTPSVKLQKEASSTFPGARFIMIRPHSRNFEYDKIEVAAMKNSILLAKNQGALGVVFGAISNSKINLKVNEELISTAKDLNLKCTFHRAFDLCANKLLSLEEIGQLGFDWVLTSGGESTAEKGIKTLSKLIENNKRKVKILTGGGVNHTNCKKFKDIGADGIHFSIDKNNAVERDKIKRILAELLLD